MTDVLTLALGDPAVHGGLRSLDRDQVLLVLEALGLLGRQLSTLDPSIDPVRLLGLALADAGGVARRHAEHREHDDDERDESMHHVLLLAASSLAAGRD